MQASPAVVGRSTYTSMVTSKGAESLSFGLRAVLLANFFHTMAFLAVITFVGDQIFGITGRPLDLGYLGVALFLPVFLLSPLGGTLVDRSDRRIVYAVPVVLEIVVSFGLVAFVRSDPTAVWPFFVFAGLFGAARAFASPASRTLPIDLANSSQLDRMIALKALSLQMGVVVGPVVAGFLAVVSPELPYLFAGIVLLIVLVLLVFVPKPRTERLETAPGPRQAVTDAVEGFRYVRNNDILRGVIGLDLFAVLLGGATALLPAIAEERLGVSEVGLGWLRAADGMGAASVSLLLSFVAFRRNIGKILLYAVGVFGLATIVLGLTTNYAVAFGAIFVLSAADAVSVYIRSSVVPLATPENMRGRVVSLENVFIGGSNELGSLESGIAAQAIGVVGSIVTGGVGTVMVVVFWWWKFPGLRKVDRFEDVRVGGLTPLGTSEV